MQTVFEMVECGNFKFSTLRTLCIHFSSPRRKELRRRRNGINIVFGERAENTNFSNVLNLTSSLLAFGSGGGGWSSTKYIYLHNWNWTHNKVFKFLISNREIEKREYNLSEIYSNSRFDSNLFYGIMWKKGKLCVLRKIPFSFPFFGTRSTHWLCMFAAGTKNRELKLKLIHSSRARGGERISTKIYVWWNRKNVSFAREENKLNFRWNIFTKLWAIRRSITIKWQPREEMKSDFNQISHMKIHELQNPIRSSVAKQQQRLMQIRKKNHPIT